MSEFSLFGLSLFSLFAAMAQVESDNGKTSRNVYQIGTAYLDDVNRIYPHHYAAACVYDRFASQCIMMDYWRYYAPRYSKRTGKPVTFEVLARIHNGGPHGAEKACTLPYWEKVRAELAKISTKKGTKQ